MVKIIKKDDGFYKQIPMDKEVQEAILSLKRLFKDMYGRDITKSDEALYVFWNTFDDKKTYDTRVINMMRQTGINEADIYVYYKTGRIPTKINKKFLTKAEKQEIDFYYKEYKKLISQKLKDKKVNILQFVNFANAILYEKYDTIDTYIASTLNDFLRRHLEEHQDFLDYKIQTEIDFLGFCCIKISKDLESIKSLIKLQMTENIYSVCRSIFETYLHLVNLAYVKDYFHNNILKNIKNATCDFYTSQNGEISYNQLIVKKDKTKNISLYSLCEKSPYSTDITLYNVFYRSACQFVHTDVMSAKSYFHKWDPFLEVDVSLTAAIIGLTCATLLIEQFANIKRVKPEYKTDIKYLACNLKKELGLCYQILNSDPVNRNDIFNCFINRLKETLDAKRA